MKLYTKSEVEKAEKKKKELVKARNNAAAAIDEAKARYVKRKTRARSKKEAQEKDALINSPRFDKLKDYDRREDIIEAYGYDCITMKECDDLENLWDEREAIRNRVSDGYYRDMVTEALDEAFLHVSGLWEDEIEECAMIEKEWEKQCKEAAADIKKFMDKVNADYEKYVMGA